MGWPKPKRVWTRAALRLSAEGAPWQESETEVDAGQVGRRALCTTGALAGQLRLKWVQARMSWDPLSMGHPGVAAGVQVGNRLEVLLEQLELRWARAGVPGVLHIRGVL